MLLDVGRSADALASCREALPVLKKLATDHPGAPHYAIELGNCYQNLAELTSLEVGPLPALEFYGEAVAKLEAVVAKDARQAVARTFLRHTYRGRARALTRLERHAEALRDWDAALKLDDGSERTEIELGRAASQARAGAPDKVLKEVEALVKGEKASADALYDAACVYSLGSASKGEAPLRERYAARATGLLRLAAGKGYKDIVWLKADRALDPLRERPDFQQVFRELEAKAKPDQAGSRPNAGLPAKN
jgi:tetratricopeptide (TPR) repeat protein